MTSPAVSFAPESRPYILHCDSFPEVDVTEFEKWSAKKLADYIGKAGMKEYKEVLVAHKVDGKVANLITDHDLKDMGIARVGDRIRLRQLFTTLDQKARVMKRNNPISEFNIWSSEEHRFDSEGEEFCCTWGYCCLGEPSHYRLQKKKLKMKDVQHKHCGPITMYCCDAFSTFKMKTVELSNVDDVDIIETVSPCCANSRGRDIIEVKMQPVSDGDKPERHILYLKRGDGELAYKKIMKQVHSAQMKR